VYNSTDKDHIPNFTSVQSMEKKIGMVCTGEKLGIRGFRFFFMDFDVLEFV
jgi:hypothetical protein